MHWFAALLLISMATPADARPPIVVSAKPDDISIAIYRDNNRSYGDPIAFGDDSVDPAYAGPLGGFAMITETRTLDLPPGEVVVRFEGVASGIIPQSAILYNADIKEQNFDAKILSQRGLIDAFTGQAVTLKRFDPKAKTYVVERATLRSNPDGLVLQTKNGFEAIQCEAGFGSGLLFPNVPVDLTAKPTLSLTTKATQKGGKTKLTLAYLANNFDWQANYILQFEADGQTATLSGSMTLANQDETSFHNAKASGVAGRPARVEKTTAEEDGEYLARENDPYSANNIALKGQCWPKRSTLKVPETPNVSAPAPSPAYYVSGDGGDDAEAIVVTASRRVSMSPLGDLKQYSIDRRTTLGAQSIKQVSFLPKTKVRIERVYRARYSDQYADDVVHLLRFKNDKANGLGMPLPMGQIIVYQKDVTGQRLIRQTGLPDKAVDEDVEFGSHDDNEDQEVSVDQEEISASDTATIQEIVVTNDHDEPITFEMEFKDTEDYKLDKFSKRVFKRRAAQVWKTTIPANGEATIRFRETDVPAAN